MVEASGDADVPGAIKELTGGIGVDYAFEVIGVPGFGLDVSVPGIMLPLDEKSLVGSLYGSANMRRDMPKLIDLYMRGKLKIDELVSRRIKLDDVNRAFEAMEKGEVARSVIVY